jgi:hypothetical protein
VPFFPGTIIADLQDSPSPSSRFFISGVKVELFLQFATHPVLFAQAEQGSNNPNTSQIRC